MRIIKEDIHTVRYQIDIPQSAIDILKEDYESSVRNDTSYYDSWEVCLYEFLNELYNEPYTFEDNGYCEIYGIKINTFEDWDTNDNGIDIERIVNTTINTGQIPNETVAN